MTEPVSQTEDTKEVSMFEVLSFLNFIKFVFNNINDAATMNIDVENLKLIQNCDTMLQDSTLSSGHLNFKAVLKRWLKTWTSVGSF